MQHRVTAPLALVLVAGVTACASARSNPPPAAPTPAPAQHAAVEPTSPDSPSGPFRAAEEGGPINNSTTAFPSTYEPIASGPVLIRNATVMTAAGPTMQHASVLLRDGKVAAVGTDVTAPPDATVVDGTGKWVTPGLVDVHSHLGDYPAPGVDAVSDGNELTNPNTAQVWAEHSIWPQDPQFALALAGGVTTIEILPGSGNLFGGRGVVIRNVPATTVQAMKFPGAPYALKMACGENPKRVYGSKGRAPSTRMGEMAGFRQAWIDAKEYRRKWDEWRADGSDPTKMPHRDLQMETLVSVLEGQSRIQNHCYRADEMAQMIAMSHEFGYKIAAFHHGVEAYKIRDLLKKEGICVAMWSDWWGFKLEAYDGIRQNIALIAADGGCAILHTDDPNGIQRMNQDAAKSLEAGLEVGIHLTPDDAIQWITINPAKDLGIADQTGSLEVGKRGDVVVWSGDPFSVYTKAEKVYIDGALLYDRADPNHRPVSDFMAGQPRGAR
jgi:imidazolonepropionase-like amidohydrolase